jgi:hypothetical protein
MDLAGDTSGGRGDGGIRKKLMSYPGWLIAAAAAAGLSVLTFVILLRKRYAAHALLPTLWRMGPYIVLLLLYCGADVVVVGNNKGDEGSESNEVQVVPY